MRVNYKSNILILGSSGLIGHQIYNYLLNFEEYNILGVSKSRKFKNDDLNIDFENINLLEKLINEFKPNIIINCAGKLISASNKSPDSAIYLNAYFPHLLLKIADKANAKLIHISTDCVFSGNKGNYSENELKDGTTIYSKTKSLGEINSNKHLTIRTSVIGPEIDLKGEELFNWFMCQSKPIEGYTESIWSGVSTIVLASVIKRCVDKNITGIYNVTTKDPINKFDLLSLINKFRFNKILINPVIGVKSNKSLIDTRSTLDYIYPSYFDQVSEIFELIHNSKSLYSHYLNK